MTEGISIRIRKDSPAFDSTFFYPWEKLRQFSLSPDTYSWDFAAKLPSITLDPGEQFEQCLALEDAYKFEQPGKYTVTFSTEISVLVGDKKGPYADASPIRVVAESSQSFVVSGQSR